MQTRNVCLVGAGGIGLVHLDAYLADSTVTVHVVELDTKKRNDLKAKNISVYASLTDVDCSDIDYFDVCTPTATHLSIIADIQRLQTKAKILCEKPLSNSKNAIHDYFDGEQAFTGINVAFVERFNDPYVAAKKYVTNNTLIELSRHTKRPSKEWFNLAGKDADVLLDLGIHDLDCITWYMQSVLPVAISDHYYEPKSYEEFTLEYANNIRVHCNVGWDIADSADYGIRTTISVKKQKTIFSYDSLHEELVINEEHQPVVPRFPAAYHKEISAFLHDDCTKQFPTYDEIMNTLELYELIVKDRKGINT